MALCGRLEFVRKVALAATKPFKLFSVSYMDLYGLYEFYLGLDKNNV